MRDWPSALKNAACALALGVCAAGPALAQTTTAADVVAAQLQELRAAIEAMRGELAASRKESQDLRQQLDAVRAQVDALRRGPEPDRVSTLAQDLELVAAKVEDQEQTKVESGSKYHVRLSGMVLFGVVSSHGYVDNLDLPFVASAKPAGESGGAFAAGFRQSFVGVSVFGPTVGGAKASGTVSFDVFAGFPASTDGLSSGLGRLRTASFALDWAKTSLVASQDAPFFSPHTPTSISSVAYPALSSSGNIWAWTPQLHVEHRFAVSADSSLVAQAGILDPLTGELPASEYSRLPTAGERTGWPAEAVRVAWQRPSPRPMSVGGGAYHSAQNWGFNRTVDAWAATADWTLPLGARVTFTGEAYRGRAIAGLGAGASPSVLFDGSPASPFAEVLPLSSNGGWAQLTLTATPRVEFNAAFGQDHVFRAGLDAVALSEGVVVSRNASGFANAIYRPRSNLLFSLEYRQLWTTRFDGTKQTARHLSFVSGIIF